MRSSATDGVVTMFTIDPAKILVVEAQLADLDIVLSILDEAAAWITARGIDQWRPGSFSRADLARQIEQDEVYLALYEGLPIATFTLCWSDPVMWGPQLEDAGYVHRLAVRRTSSGQGLGALLLGWASA